MNRTNIKRIIGLIVLVVFITACGPAASAPPATPPPTETTVPDPPIRGRISFLHSNGEFTGAGIEVGLHDQALLEAEDPNAEVAKVYTDEKGYYVFPDVKPGNYSLGITVPDLDQLFSSFEGNSCTLEGFTFQDGWMLVAGQTADGKSILTGVGEPFDLKEGDQLEYNLAINCTN